MHTRTQPFSRRRFLGGLTLGGTAGLLGVYPRPVAAEPPPETTRIRLIQFLSPCGAPAYLSEELLRAEGFTDVQWVKSDVYVLSKDLVAGTVDLEAVEHVPLFERPLGVLEGLGRKPHYTQVAVVGADCLRPGCRSVLDEEGGEISVQHHAGFILKGEGEHG